jgi:hypothetical protein
MASDIMAIHQQYGNYTEILPEEVNDSTKQELTKLRGKAEEVLKEDSVFIDSLLKKAIVRINLADFDDQLTIARNSYFLKNEPFRGVKRVKYFLAHRSMAKQVLSFLMGSIIEETDLVIKDFKNYLSLPISREKRIAFINLTRNYQFFIGHAVNILDVIDDYDDAFNMLCKELDPTYAVPTTRSYSAIFPHELTAGVRELLLRGNTGRRTPSPLIRSLLESQTVRMLLSPPVGSKHAGKQVLLFADFSFSDILNALDVLKVTGLVETDIVRRLYSWGSVSVHYAYSMRHASIWYALFLASSLVSTLQDEVKVNPYIDQILDYLTSKGKITIQ